jgi:GT2 family glycosyltransferase
LSAQLTGNPRLPNGNAASLVAPAAVRVIDLEEALEDMRLSGDGGRARYRSVLVVARLGRNPIGLATLPVDHDGVVPRERLVLALRRLADGSGCRRARLTRAEDRRDPAVAPFVSVVVPTCGNLSMLEPCLRALLASDYGEFEVIVVDNRPRTSDTRWMLTTWFSGESRLRYVAEPRPGGSPARNAGLRHAVGEIVAFTDDDVVVDRRWIRANVESLAGGDDVGCVTGLILPRELETDSQLLLEQFASFGKGFRVRTFRLPDSRADNPLFPYTPGTLGSGASMAFRTELVRELGGFDCALGTATPACGGEDLDLFIRVLQSGHAVSYDPRAVVWHRHPDGMPRLRRQVFQYGVGLGAALAKQLIAGPRRRELLRAVPAGVRYARDPASRKNAGRPAAFPERLSRREWLGTLLGPGAYVLSAVRLLLRRLVGADRWRRTASSPGMLLCAAAICLAAPLAVALGAPPPLRLAAVLAFVCAGPGTALVTAAGGRLEPGLVVGAGTAVTALVAQCMLWLGSWRPEAWLYAVAAVCLVPLAGAMRGALRGTPLRRPLRARAIAVPGEALLHASVLSLAALLWAASLLGADLGRMSGLGLLDAMPATYFLIFPLLLVGFAVSATRARVRPWALAAYVFALIVVIHGTTAVLYSEPRYAWVYKHLGVINLIAATGHADRDIDIYNNWPAFFAANAWLSRATGVAPIAYAGWAQLFFNVFGALAMRFALLGLTRDERQVWTATLFFVLGNWVGQDYLAPQAFGFVLSLVVLGLCLRCGRATSRLGSETYRASPLGPRAALVIGGACFLAVVASHQLSPVVLILSVAGLALFVRAVPLWVPAAMVAVEAWWLWLAWAFLTRHFSLIEPATRGAGAPGRDLARALDGAAVTFYSPAAVMATVGALAAVGAVRRFRAGRRDVAPLCLIGAPLLAVLVQSYGGEGPYRAYLFALPWLAFFVAAAFRLTGAVSRGHRLGAAGFVAAASAVAAFLLPAYFGQELANRITPQDVRAANWYERNAPPGSIRIELAPNAPDRLTARYPLVSLSDPSSLVETRGFTGHRLGAADVPRLERVIDRQRAKAAFVVLALSQESYARLNGLLPRGSASGLAAALARSGRFVLVYRNSTAWVFRYAGTGAA